MNKKLLSKERKQYLKNRKCKQYLVTLTQIAILVAFLAIWEILANKKVIDSFIMSQPSRIWQTFMNLSSNDLVHHIGVTVYETMIGFLVGTGLGIMIAIVLWWSNFLSKVAEPYLVVLNSLPKVALRTSYYYLGRCRNTCYYSNGSSNCNGGLFTTNEEVTSKVQEIRKNKELLDRDMVTGFFRQIKNNKIITNPIKLKIDRCPNIMQEQEKKDFIEQMIYYRKLRGYTQKQVGQAIKVTEDTYRDYEKRNIDLKDIHKIKKIIKFLKFEEEPQFSEYVKFLMSSPEKKLQKYLNKNNISKNRFSQISGVNRRTMIDWFNGNKSISEESYKKIKKAIIKIENDKSNNLEIE